jgi:hypothetical protein
MAIVHPMSLAGLRSAITTCLAAALLALVASLCGGLAGPAAPALADAVPETWTLEASVWGAFAVGPRERSLDIMYEEGGCGSRNVQASVRETRAHVLIGVSREVPSGPGLVCPAFERFVPLRVALAAPLAGRAIEGAAPMSALAPMLGRRTPRLIGFAPRDAEQALRNAGLRARIRVQHGARGLARVVAQYPAPGQAVQSQGIVRVRVLER